MHYTVVGLFTNLGLALTAPETRYCGWHEAGSATEAERRALEENTEGGLVVAAVFAGRLKDSTTMSDRTIPNTNEIQMYCHCGRCVSEKPADRSPRDWAQLEVGWTALGVQVWCKRHECNVVHMDFEGQKHPANTTARKTPQEG